MADRVLCIFGDEAFQLGLGTLVFEISWLRSDEYGGEVRPSVRRAHINDTDCLDPGLRWVDAEKGRGLSAFDTAPELPLGRNDEVLVERIGMDLNLHPLASAGNDRKHRRSGRHYPHIVLQLRHVLVGRGLLREGPRQHELRLKYSVRSLKPAIERGCHPPEHGVAD